MPELMRVGVVIDDGGAAERVERLMRALEKLGGVADQQLPSKVAKTSKATKGAAEAFTDMDRVTRAAESAMRRLAFRAAELPGPLGSVASAALRVGLSAPKIIGVFAAIGAGAVVVRGVRKEFQDLAQTSDDLHKKLDQLAQGRAPQLGAATASMEADAAVKKARDELRRLHGGGFSWFATPDLRTAGIASAEANLATAKNVQNLAKMAENEARVRAQAEGWARAVELGTASLDDAYAAVVKLSTQLGVLPDISLEASGLAGLVAKRWEQAAQVRFENLEKARDALKDMEATMAGGGRGSILDLGSTRGGTYADRLVKALEATRTLADREREGGLASILATIPLKPVMAKKGLSGTVAERAMLDAERTKQIWTDTFSSMEAVSAGFFLHFRREGLGAFVTLADQMFDVWLELLGRLASARLFESLFGAAIGESSDVPLPGKAIKVKTKHQGGVVGQGWSPERAVDPALFFGARRYHSGGIVGDEVPIIARRGETVLPKGAAAGGEMAVHVDQHFNMMAPDQRGMRELFLQYRGVIASAVLSVAQESRAYRRALMWGP